MLAHASKNRKHCAQVINKTYPSSSPLTDDQIRTLDAIAEEWLAEHDADSLAAGVAYAAARGIETTPAQILRNRRRRSNWRASVATPPQDGRAARVSSVDAMTADPETDEHAQSKNRQEKSGKKWVISDDGNISCEDPLEILLFLEEQRESKENLRTEKKIIDAMELLKPRDRARVSSYLIDSKSVSEIAEDEGITLAAVYAAFARAEKIFASASIVQ
jgi:DNA-directed RNA polymerase specialized sigma24 family protein